MVASSLWAILSGCASKAQSLVSTVASSTLQGQQPKTTPVKVEANAQTQPVPAREVMPGKIAQRPNVLPYPFLHMLHNRPLPPSLPGVDLLNVCTLLLPGDVLPRGTIVKAVTVQETSSTLELFHDDNTILRKTDTSKTTTTATFVAPDGTRLASLLTPGTSPTGTRSQTAHDPSTSADRDADALDDTPPLLINVEINADLGTVNDNNKRDAPSARKPRGTHEHKQPTAGARTTSPAARSPSPPVPYAAQWAGRAWRLLGRR